METITIPSPSVFLSSPVIKPAPEPPPPPKRKSNVANKSAGKGSSTKKVAADPGKTKPKQSKSRNGCITCKAKRLKCDETKPSCQQCHKRSVTCGGYKKDFKWRPFEETAVANKAIPSRKRSSIPGGQTSDTAAAPSPLSEGTSSTPGADVEMENPRTSEHESFFHTTAPSPPPFHSSHGLPDLRFDHPPIFDMSTPPYMRELPRPRFEPDTVTRSLSSLFEDVEPPPISSPRPSFSGQSPRLIDLLLPGSELNARPGTVVVPPMAIPTPALTLSPSLDFHAPFSLSRDDTLDDDDIEEIVREPHILDEDLWLSFDGPPNSRASSASPLLGNTQFKFYRQPEMQAGSPEMLMMRFDKQTCGILSVKDGPTENPWRTLIWPLARESPALYHAIASMTAFHTSKEKPALRVDGMEHMRSSIRALASGIADMRTDTALATTLVLAFSESWDQHISTGIEHLRGAKILVKQALVSHKRRSMNSEDLARLKFLCNTWVYMDVIARLTSIDEDESSDFDNILDCLNAASLFGNEPSEIDPLMGCASTLFPLVGRAANLCRRVRKFETNTIQIVSQAMELKVAIERWEPLPFGTFEQPEDPTSEIQHALQTAEAYRYATLLYLHQAVPEIPSLTSAQLAKKVLVYLATVPLSSRLVIVQIYPLLAAGCEAYEQEDRQWVQQRWQSMANRMLIGNIDRCWEVMQEVWSRRDSREAAKAAAENRRQRSSAEIGIPHSENTKRKFEEEIALDDTFSFQDMLQGREKKQRHSFGNGTFSGSSSPQIARKRMKSLTEEMDPEVTVRGQLHWVGVMKDWQWEILLG